MNKEKRVIKELESLIGKPIPEKKSLSYGNFGVIYHREEVFELGLPKCGLKRFQRGLGI